MMEELNPYAPPKAEVLVASPEAVSLREAHLGTESTLKGLGVVIAVAAVLSVLAVYNQQQFLMREAHFAYQGMMPALSWKTVLTFIIGLGLWRLQRWAWFGAVAFYAAMALKNLMAIPWGLISIVVDVIILRVLLQAKSRRVVAADYHGIMLATHTLRSGLPSWAKWLGGLMALAGAVYAWGTFFQASAK